MPTLNKLLKRALNAVERFDINYVLLIVAFIIMSINTDTIV